MARTEPGGVELAELRRRLRAGRQLRLSVKVIPKSSRSEFAGRMDDGTLKIRIQAPPEKGKANSELCSFLAGIFEVSPRNVEIVSGHASARKQVRVSA